MLLSINRNISVPINGDGKGIMECDRRKKGPADRMAYHDMGKCLLKSLTMDVIDLVIKLADLHSL